MGGLGNMVWGLLLLFCWIGCLSAQNTSPGIPHYLSSTFFGGANRISVPRIPNSISDPALNAPTFVPFQGSLSHQPLSPGFSNVRQSAVLRPQNQLSPAEVRPNTGALFAAPFVNLGQPAPQQLPAIPALPQVEPLRLGKAVESGPVPRPGSASPGPGSVPAPAGPISALKESLGQALEQATKSVQFSSPPDDSPGLGDGGDNFGPPSITRLGPGQGSGFPQRQILNSAPGPSILNPSVSQSSLPGLGSFNQFRSGGEPNQISLGQALEQASQSAQFSLPASGSTAPGQGGPPPSIGQGPGSPQTSRAPFPQRFNSPSSLSPGPGFSRPPQLDLEEALTKASEEALGRAGSGPQLSNIGPVIPAVPVGPSESSPSGSFRPSESNLFRGNTGSPSSPLIRQQSIGSPNIAQSGPPLVFDATPAGSDFDRQPFRSDPKISEQRIQSSGERASTKIFLGSTQLSETPRSLPSASGRNEVPIPVKSCTRTSHEECHNEYKMVCEETFTEREKYECNIVEETKREKGVTTEYEPACFQQILENCESICKRGIQPNCMPQCARSLGKTSCHKVKVVTPHTTCTKA